jgi:hypothetical protein
MGKRNGYKPFPTWRRGEVGVINSFLLVEGRKGYKPFPTFGVGKGRGTSGDNPFKGKKNELNARQIAKKRRLMKFIKKK